MMLCDPSAHTACGWPIIYEVHNLFVHVLSLMAQVNVKNNACPLRYSAVRHSLKLTIYQNNFHCTLVFPSIFHY